MIIEIWNYLLAFFDFLNNVTFAAFIGSFTAFIFGIIAYIYTKKREKWVTHHNALVKTERLINRHLNGISNNTYLLKGAIEVYEKGGFSENVLQPFDDPDFDIEFHNVELLNMYQDYQALLEKVNHDMESWNRSNERLFNVALSGRVKDEDIEMNRKGLAERTKVMVSAMEDLLKEAYTTGACVRVFLRIDKRDKFARLGPTAKIKLSKREVSKERRKFIKESQETMEKDKKRTSKY